MKLYGDKAKPSLLEDYDYYDKFTNNTGCIITVSDNRIEVKQYTGGGVKKDEFTIEAKRPKTIENITPENAIDSFNLEYDPTTELLGLKNYMVTYKTYLLRAVTKIKILLLFLQANYATKNTRLSIQNLTGIGILHLQ